jgi:hypothetical protein
MAEKLVIFDSLGEPKDDSNLRSRAGERLFSALPIGDGGTKGGATYRFYVRDSDACL